MAHGAQVRVPGRCGNDVPARANLGSIQALLGKGPHGPRLVRVMNLHWKRPLPYVLLPILVFLAFVGFPPPFAPPRAMRPGQEQSQAADRKSGEPHRQAGA